MTFYKNFGISFDGFNFENFIVSNQTTKIFTIWQDYEFDIPFILGSICAVFLLSTLINFIFLRNTKEPRRDIISILSAYNILGGIMIALSIREELVFARAYLFLAPAAIIVLIIKLYKFKIKNK